ncbi:hypothetical protein NXT3_PB00270 (plasmid) [Sinorhizobium fredii]|uniref:Uncharacterized protein n=1 Tax=Rhizobium fredii TaxID=380 RepID=A0A2L0HBQ0_RHIFR|nr:hypothetical protein NXT3_PB00270 [Sinorhizobium fredii]
MRRPPKWSLQKSPRLKRFGIRRSRRATQRNKCGRDHKHPMDRCRGILGDLSTRTSTSRRSRNACSPPRLRRAQAAEGRDRQLASILDGFLLEAGQVHPLPAHYRQTAAHQGH